MEPQVERAGREVPQVQLGERLVRPAVQAVLQEVLEELQALLVAQTEQQARLGQQALPEEQVVQLVQH